MKLVLNWLSRITVIILWISFVFVLTSVDNLVKGWNHPEFDRLDGIYHVSTTLLLSMTLALLAVALRKASDE